jgi:hypothetical protein
MNTTITDVLQHLLSERQRTQISTALFNPRLAQPMRTALARIATLWDSMPAAGTAETNRQRTRAFVHYHYAGAAWWLLEQPPQLNQPHSQALGLADLADGTPVQYGYIDLTEVLELGAELDLFYQPQLVQDILTTNTGNRS